MVDRSTKNAAQPKKGRVGLSKRDDMVGSTSSSAGELRIRFLGVGFLRGCLVLLGYIPPLVRNGTSVIILVRGKRTASEYHDTVTMNRMQRGAAHFQKTRNNVRRLGENEPTRWTYAVSSQ